MGLVRGFGLLASVATLSLGLQAGPARATSAASTLHTGNGGTCLSGFGGTVCPYLYNNGTEVGAIGAGSFDIAYNPNNSTTFAPPILAILGVPNTSASAGVAPVLTSASLPGSEPVTISAGSGAFGLSATSFNPAGLYTGGTFSSGTGDVYSFLGLAGTANNSNSFTNWSGADSAVASLNVTNFSIYVFALKPSGNAFSNTNNPITVNFSQMDKGTFVVGYAQETGGRYDATPFTEAGLATTSASVLSPPGNQNSVPEPASSAVLAIGLLGLIAIRARPRRV